MFYEIHELFKVKFIERYAIENIINDDMPSLIFTNVFHPLTILVIMMAYPVQNTVK